MISLLRHKIQILKQQRTPDEAGGAAVSYVAQRSQWAEVKWLRSKSRNIGFRRSNHRRAVIRLRARGEINFSDRISLRGQSYAITSIIEEASTANFIQLEIEEMS